MEVGFRVLWSDLPDLDGSWLGRARETASSWADRVVGHPGGGTWQARITSPAGRDQAGRPVHGLECFLSGAGPDRKDRSASVRIASCPDHILVRVETRGEVERPGVVDDLLDLARDPYLGRTPVPPRPVPFPAGEIDALARLLDDPGRTLPVVVCSEPGWRHPAGPVALPDAVDSKVRGCAVVVGLDPPAQTAFRKALGPLACWGGAVRVYAPGPLGSDPLRHPYLTADSIAADPDGATDQISRLACRHLLDRPVPEPFRIFTSLAAPAPAEPDPPGEDRPEDAEDDPDGPGEESLDGLVGELSDEVARLTGHLARIHDELCRRGLEEVWQATGQETAGGPPDEVTGIGEAVLAARIWLSDWLVVASDAGRDLDVLDATPTARAWGNSCWRGLRALAAYAHDRASGFDGNFWRWCERGGPLAWPASRKRLSMGESRTVTGSAKLSADRLMPVSTLVDPSGRIHMWAHLKIAEGGGNLAPRVYFHDDTAGDTHKVHVGFVGPHRFVRNTRT